MNIIQVIGNLGQDPETRYTPSGQKVTSFTIASNSKKSGKDVTTWFRISVWGDRFDKMMSYMKKGSFVLVSGELSKPEIYNNREGQSQVSLEVTADIIKFLPSKGGDKEREGGQSQSGSEGFGGGGFGDSRGSNFGKNQDNAFSQQEEEEEIPF